MPEKKPDAKKASAKKTSAKKAPRVYEADTLNMQSLRLIAAPNPKDDLDLDPEEILAYVQQKSHSPELVQQLIDYIRRI
jgi:hypothetical protein